MIENRVFGTEIEWGASAIIPGEEHKGLQPLPDKVTTELIGAYLAYLAAQGLMQRYAATESNGGYFTTNGGRFYAEHNHPESCTAVHKTIKGVLAQETGDEEIWTEAFEYGLERGIIARSPSKTEASYTLNKRAAGQDLESFGAHVSLQTDRRFIDPLKYARDHEKAFYTLGLLFASSGVITGSGGLYRHPQTGEVRFVTSQKGARLETDFDLRTTIAKPVVNLREEPHADKLRFARLHVTSFDTNVRYRPGAVRIGSILATLAMIESGETLADEFRLEGSLTGLAWHTAGDLTCKKIIRLANGNTITAAELQEEFVKRTSEYKDLFSDELRVVHDRWAEAASAAQFGPAALSECTDWVPRHDIILREADRRSVEVGRSVGLSDPHVMAADTAFDRASSKQPGKVPVPQKIRARDARQLEPRDATRPPDPRQLTPRDAIWYPTSEDVQHYKFNPPTDTSAYDLARAVQYMGDNLQLGMLKWSHVDAFSFGRPISFEDPRVAGSPAIDELIARGAAQRLPDPA